MANRIEDIAAKAAETTTALNPLMLRQTTTNPKATMKFAGRMTKENVEILLGKSERAPEPKDRRFKDPAWAHNPFYKRGLQTYLAMQDNLNEWVGDLAMGELEHARAQFVMGMINDALAPTNTFIGNPAARKRAIESGGLSLVKGLKNAYNDLTKNGGMPSQVDSRPFEVGKNLATTPGEVVWKNEILELIQYAPMTDKVYKTPFLIIPPQINKFYANDLTPMTSIIQFLLAHNFQPFIVSWRNPTKEHAAWGLTDYVDALVQTTDVIRHITGSKKINISGACSGGITTATLASLLASAGDNRINSLSMFVCVLDPQKDDSDLGQIVSERSLEIARRYSRRKGILEGESLARMFAWMRPNDLVWNYVVNNYLLGQDPPPYDVLFWNNDTTNLPAQLHSDYLDMGISQPFSNPGEVEIAGHIADLTAVKADTYILCSTRQ
jgi:polyhydroxyalkanoate synthase